MLFYTRGQGGVFLAMLLAGAVLGALYDVTALLRRALSAGRALSLACDLLFGLLGACWLAVALLTACYGEVRVYALLGALSGFVLYESTVGWLLRLAARALHCFLRRAARGFGESEAVRKFFR